MDEQILNMLDEADRQQTVEQLSYILQSTEDFEEGRKCISILSSLGESSVLPLAYAFINLARADLQQVIIGTIRGMGDQALSMLVSTIRDENSDSDTRRASIYILAKVGGKRALAPLLAMLTDKGDYIRGPAAYALGLLGDRSAVESLVSMVQDPAPNVRISVAEALGMLGDQRATTPLISLLSDAYVPVRAEAARALGAVGDASALSALIFMQQNDEGISSLGSNADIASEAIARIRYHLD